MTIYCVVCLVGAGRYAVKRKKSQTTVTQVLHVCFVMAYFTAQVTGAEQHPVEVLEKIREMQSS